MSSSAMGMHPTEVRQGKEREVSSIPFPSYLTPYDVSAHIIWCEMTFSAFRKDFSDS